METIAIIEKEYLPEQQTLIDIFKQHMQSIMPEFPIIFKMPNIPNKVRKQISHIPCKSVGKRGGHELVSMKVIDFVRLMAKSGIEMKIYEQEADHDQNQNQNR